MGINQHLNIGFNFLDPTSDHILSYTTNLKKASCNFHHLAVGTTQSRMK